MTDDIEFMRTVWRALKMVTSYLEKKYGFGQKEPTPKSENVVVFP